MKTSGFWAPLGHLALRPLPSILMAPPPRATTASTKLGDGKAVKESRPEVKTLQEAAIRLSRAVQMLKAAEDDANGQS